MTISDLSNVINLETNYDWFVTSMSYIY